MNTFRWVFVEVCHSFSLVNMRFVVKFIFFPFKFYKKMYFVICKMCSVHGKFITEFYFFFNSHACSLG